MTEPPRTHTRMFDNDDATLARVRDLALGFPDATERVTHGRPTFRAGDKGKVFGIYGASRKGDLPGRHEQFPAAVVFKPEESERRAFDADARFFVPAYWGPYGWLALSLAHARVDWSEVAELLDASYRQVASARLVKRLDG